MKLFKIFFFLLTAISVAQAQSIVGGAGTFKVNGDPDNISSLTVINQKSNPSIAIDTTNGNVYYYDVTKSVGSRWNTLNPAITSIVGGGDITVSTANGVTTIAYTDGDKSPTNELNTSFTVASGNLNIIDAGGTKSVAVTSIAPVQSVVATGSLTASTASNVTTINYVDPDPSASNEIQTMSSSAPSANAVTIALSLSGGSYTVTGGNGISITGSAGAYTITNTAAPPVTKYTSDTTAAAGGVALEAPYKVAFNNMFGLPEGAVMYRSN